MAPRLHLVTGKGGVGKTSVATMLALAEVQEGRRVLLAEMNGGGQAAQFLGMELAGSNLQRLSDELHVVNMTPAASIYEYGLLILRFETVTRAVFNNRLVQHLLRLVPSLGELTMLGKIWYHEQEIENGVPRFDVIVVDAPATGHAITLLRTPGAVARTVPPGAMRDNCQKIIDMLVDGRRTVLNIVTTPEEMPVNEAIEIEQAAADLDIAVGTTFINQRLSALPKDTMSRLEPLPQELKPLLEVLNVRASKVLQGEQHLSRLPARLWRDVFSLPRLAADPWDRSVLAGLAQRYLEHRP